MAREPRARTPLPAKILCGYSGFWLDRGNPKAIGERLLEPMRNARFTVVDLKIQPTDFDLMDPAQYARLQGLCAEVTKRGLVLTTYVYPHPHHGRRNPRAPDRLPAFVREDGTRLANRYSLIHWEVWREVFDNAFQLAKASLELPVAAVKVDLETINSTAVSYDDGAWQRFAPLHGLSSEIPAAQRAVRLEKKDLKETYRRWFFSQFEVVAKRFERELHAINPDLHLGMMPAQNTPLLRAFAAHLGTPRAPAIIDHWCMYNGSGFDGAAREAGEWVRGIGPNNLFVPWFRLNNYHAEDIGVQAYHAAFYADGYNCWSMGMLERSLSSPTYSLPEGETAAGYYAGFKRANLAALADLADRAQAPQRIPFKAVVPLAPPLELEGLKIPQLMPAGDGTGTPAWLHLRDQQVVYLHARSGETIRVDLRHLAGKSRQVALHYVLITPNHTELRHETVSPGATEEFTVTAPEKGTYALVITGGAGGQAWYAVRVRNRHMALRLQPFAYWFFRGPATLWFTRLQDRGEAKAVFRTARNQVFGVRTETESWDSVRTELRLPIPEGKRPFAVTLFRPETIPDGCYVQDIYISVEGAAAPLVSDGPQRRLLPVP